MVNDFLLCGCSSTNVQSSIVGSEAKPSLLIECFDCGLKGKLVKIVTEGLFGFNYKIKFEVLEKGVVQEVKN